MRALDTSSLDLAGPLKIARPLILPAMLAFALVQPLSAQSSGGGFSLPQPTPSPTAAPQGPADERAGVQIGPRVIRQPQPTTQQPSAPPPEAAPAPTPTPTPTATQPPAPARSAPTTSTPSRSTAQRPAQTTPTPSASTTAPPPSATSSAPAEPASGASIPLETEVTPGFDTLPDPDAEPIGPDDWYDVENEGAAPSRSSSAPAGSFDAPVDLSYRNIVIGGIALIILLAAGLGFLLWRRRREEAQQFEDEAPSLARGVSQTLAKQMSESVADIADGKDSDPDTPASFAKPRAQAAPRPAPQPSPPPRPAPEPISPAPAEPRSDVSLAGITKPTRIDLGLEIVSASRSVMMFSVEFRLDVANRSDRAVRDLIVSAQLASAERGNANSAPIAAGQPIAEIGRIGPQQSQRVTGELRLPLRDVQPIHQGRKPLFIPLIHVTLDGAGQPAITRSFVVGSPSTTSTGRVHPLPLDGPPGGLPGLRAQLIKQGLGGDTKAAQPA